LFIVHCSLFIVNCSLLIVNCSLFIVNCSLFIVFIFGACIGSFLNVVVYRLPAGMSVVTPPSRCPHCSHKLGPRENIPVLGWLLLKGRCRWCSAPISPRYPLVETITGLLFVAVFIYFEYSLLTLGYFAFISWLLALSLIDCDTMTLPNPLTKSCLVAGLVFQVIRGWYTVGVTAAAHGLMLGIGAAVLGIWLFDAIAFFGALALGQAAMGAGDSKLMAAIGAWLGWKYLLLSGFLGCALGAFVGAGAMALGLLGRRQPMPFGPFLALGATLTIFWGEAILSTYMQLFFPFN